MPGLAYSLKYLRRRRRPARLRIAVWLWIAAAVVIISLFSVYRRFSHILMDMATIEANNAVSSVINNAIAEKLAAGEIKYNDIVTLEKNSDGSVSALITDMAKVNVLKSEITSEIIRDLSDDIRADISIPAGNITGISLLSGKGPSIPVEIVAVTQANTEFINRFSSAGINQTRHQIVVHVNAEVSVIMPGGNVYTSVMAEVAVAETVIIGDVPDSYTYFEGDEKWDENLERFDITT